MTNYLEQNLQRTVFNVYSYTKEHKHEILHNNLPKNYYDKKKEKNNSTYTYTYQICWAIKYLRFELTHVLK